MASVVRYLPKDTEIIALDNGSTLCETSGLLNDVQKHPRGIGLFQLDNIGVAAGRNLAAQAATGDLLLFLDDDQYLTENWINSVDTITSIDSVGAITNFTRKGVYRKGDKKKEYTIIGGGGLLVPRITFNALGGFDEQFSPAYFEEVDFGWRLAYSGVPIGKIGEKTIEHEAHSTLGDESFARPMYEKNEIKLINKWLQANITVPKRKPAKKVTPKPNPTVSVIMPLYNYEKYVGEAIESVQAQTFGDWELITIDDGSIDNGPSIVEDFASKDSRIKLVRHEQNLGLASARNTGFSHTSGRYVCILDPDDAYYPNKLERQVAFMKENPYTAMCYGDVTNSGGPPAMKRPDYNYDLLCKGNYIPCQSVMLDGYILRIIGGNNKAMRYAEDWEHWLRIASITNKVYHIGGDPIYNIRFHKDQYSIPTPETEAIIRMHENAAANAGVTYRNVLSSRPLRVMHVVHDMKLQGGQLMMYNLIKNLSPKAFDITIGYFIQGQVTDMIHSNCNWVKLYKMSGDSQEDFSMYDIVHIHHWGDEFGTVNRIARQPIPNLRVITTEHGESSANWPDDSYRKVMVYDGYKPQQKTNGNFFPSRVSIPNGIPMPIIPDGSREKYRQKIGAKDNQLVVTTVSKFVKIKGPDRYLDMCRELHHRNPNKYLFLFIGGDIRQQDAERIFTRIEGMQINNVPILNIGIVPNSEVHAYLSASDIFVMTSHTEAQPLAMLEAKAIGLPCVGPDVCGVSNIINGCGIAVDRDSSPKIFADALQKVENISTAPNELSISDNLMSYRYGVLYRTHYLYGRILSGMVH